MLFEKIFEYVVLFIKAIFSLLDVLPNVPNLIVNSINTFIDFVFNYGVNGLNFFIPISTLKILLPIVLIIVNYELIYSIFHWLYDHIPFIH